MQTCHSCGEANIPNDKVSCPICGQPLGLTVQQQPAQAAGLSAISSGQPSAVIAAVGPVPISGATIGGVGVIIPLDANGMEDTARAYAFPTGEFRLLLGRTDMNSTPPIVAQIDAGRLWPDLNTRPGGNLFSRATAWIRRDKNGQEALMHHPESSMKLVYKRAGETDYQVLLPGDEIALVPDTELVFGKSSESQTFIVR